MLLSVLFIVVFVCCVVLWYDVRRLFLVCCVGVCSIVVVFVAFCFVLFVCWRFVALCLVCIRCGILLFGCLFVF